jgi:dipeptide/tripeptide permease
MPIVDLEVNLNMHEYFLFYSMTVLLAYFMYNNIY